MSLFHESVSATNSSASAANRTLSWIRHYERQCMDRGGATMLWRSSSADQQPIAFVAPQFLKRFYLWRHLHTRGKRLLLSPTLVFTSCWLFHGVMFCCGVVGCSSALGGFKTKTLFVCPSVHV